MIEEYRKKLQLPTHSLTFRPDLPIFAPEVQQRVSMPYHDILDFRNKDRVVARVLRGMQAALQISQRAVQDWSTMLRAFEAGSSLSLRVLVGRARIGIVLRNGALVHLQNIHSKTFPGMQVSVSPRTMIDAHQH